MKPQLLLLLLLLQHVIPANGQNTIGLPEIINFSKKVYHAGTQSWDIAQDEKGVMYFANNEGLLTYDGNFWTTYPLPNKTIARSVAVGRKGRIYVGGQDELGYFSPDENGRLRYHSLKPSLPEKERSFTDVWDVVLFKDHVFFRTGTRIFQFTGEKATVSYSTDWRFMGVCNGQLIVQDYRNGLLRFRNGAWEPLIHQSFGKEFLVTGMVPYGRDTALVTTFRNGVYLLYGGQLHPFQTAGLQDIANKLIYTALATDNGQILLGTTLDGCHIIDKQGTVTQSFSRLQGLQNNNILSVYFDRDHNLWLGLDNGIDFIAYSSPIRHINPSPNNEGSGYTAYLNGNTLYIGTSNGLYSVTTQAGPDLSYAKGTFQPVANSKGQVWNLSVVNGQLLMGHHEGAFAIRDGKASLLDNSTGFWTFLPYDNVLPSSLMVSGTYNGIRLYQFRQNAFGGLSSTADFESARFVCVDQTDHTIWAAHPYKGIYKVQFDSQQKASVRLYTTKDGLCSINNNYVFKAKSHIIATSEKGIYEYDTKKDRWEHSAYFSSLFGHSNIRFVKEDSVGNIWFIHDKMLSVIDFSGEKPVTYHIPELTNKLLSGFENIYPVNNSNVFIGGENGFFHFNLQKYRQQQHDPNVHIRMVRAFGKSDSLLYGGFRTDSLCKEMTVTYPWNSMHFEFTSTLYGQAGNTEYSYFLKGYDQGWSEWSRKVEKEYTNLPPGTYTFQVRSRNSLGRESAPDSYVFTILPPWYQTRWAYGFYTVLVVVLGLILYLSQKRKFARQQQRHEEEQKRLLYLHQLELEKNEKEIIRLRNEVLESEIANKNTELASSAMHLVQKGELLSRMKEEILRLRKNMEGEKLSDEFKKIVKALDSEDRMDEEWKKFAIHFDKVHSDFLLALKSRYPSLTPNELKLSSYLRMNLSSKEIAQLMSISVRGVEISRYRLRKKLQVPGDANLFEFLMSIHSGESLKREA